MTERRTKIDIMNDMLLSIQQKGGKIKPTHLMYKANLSHKLLSKYVEEFMEKGFINEEHTKNHKVYILTDKGIDFINQYRKMKDFKELFDL
jgi:predicted transcriptional regulator